MGDVEVGRGDRGVGDSNGAEHELLLEHVMLWEFECYEIENGEGSEASMKGFAIKASMSDMVSLGQGGEKTVGVKVFLIEEYREEVLVIKDEVGSDGFGRKVQE